MKLHLDNNIAEGTPEELAKYKELIHKTKREVDEEGFDAGNYSILSPEAQTPSTDIKVGDRVKVLKSKGGAEGEATVTAVLICGAVELAGTNKNGMYLTDWANHVSNLEKIEEEDKQEEDRLMGYIFWYFEGSTYNKFVVLQASPEGYFETSIGKRYTYQAVSGLIKPIDNVYTREEFEEAKDKRGLLSYYPVVDLFSTSY